MKLIFTIIFSLVVFLSGYSQKPAALNAKSGTLYAGINVDPQVFSINKVYPNPVKDFVTVDLQSQNSGQVEIVLFNILGAQIKKWQPKYISTGDQQLKLDLSFAKTGVYILKLTSSGQVCSQVIKKN
ncbi:MAG: T9SS type A sorting domain-containing protein [Prolixibacteraceae bacterium]|jgi:hypothetical protein